MSTVTCCAHLDMLRRVGSLVGPFYLNLGRAFEPRSLPPNVSPGAAKACYANAGRLALERDDLNYCEGFALRPGLFPLHHAWCVTDEGQVVDPTWPYEQGMEYHGVVLSKNYLRRTIEDTGVWGVLAEMLPGPQVLQQFESYLHANWMPELLQRNLFLEALNLALPTSSGRGFR